MHLIKERVSTPEIVLAEVLAEVGVVDVENLPRTRYLIILREFGHHEVFRLEALTQPP